MFSKTTLQSLQTICPLAPNPSRTSSSSSSSVTGTTNYRLLHCHCQANLPHWWCCPGNPDIQQITNQCQAEPEHPERLHHLIRPAAIQTTNSRRQQKWHKKDIISLRRRWVGSDSMCTFPWLLFFSLLRDTVLGHGPQICTMHYFFPAGRFWGFLTELERLLRDIASQIFPMISSWSSPTIFKAIFNPASSPLSKWN